ncbi:type II secretion system protein GspM [Neptunicella sp.]|uniref:type II secretion system protein GspM n=1 Tax=Neptunicella sp. TaxID=2125986 RepID=UPI003F6915D7
MAKSNVTKPQMSLSHKFYALSIREKSLILAAGLIFILFSGYWWVIEPQLIDINNAEQQNKKAQLQTENLNVQIQELQQVLQVDPDEVLKQQIASLIKRQVSLGVQLTEQTINLVSAKQMPQLLSNVLNNSQDIKLVSMTSIPATMLTQQGEHKNANTQIYQHGVKLILEGKYFSIQQYLQRLSNSPWKFYWRKFDYRVKDYPVGTVELELYTLSTNQAFIGI